MWNRRTKVKDWKCPWQKRRPKSWETAQDFCWKQQTAFPVWLAKIRHPTDLKQVKVNQLHTSAVSKWIFPWPHSSCFSNEDLRNSLPISASWGRDQKGRDKCSNTETTSSKLWIPSGQHLGIPESNLILVHFCSYNVISANTWKTWVLRKSF